MGPQGIQCPEWKQTTLLRKNDQRRPEETGSIGYQAKTVAGCGMLWQAVGGGIKSGDIYYL